MEDISVFWLVVIVVAIVAVMVTVIYFAYQADKKEQPEIYKAWVKVFRRPDITFEEWKKLKDAGILPGQVNDNSGSSSAMGLAAGICIGSSISQ